MGTHRIMNFILAAALAVIPLSAKALQPAISYDRVGVFEDLGGPAYRYRVVDPEGLKRMVLPGIYPNVERAKGGKISSEEMFKKSKIWALPVEENLKFWGAFDPKRSMDPRFTEGVRQFYYAQALQRAGRLHEAVYAYYAVAVHFPGERDPNRNWPQFWPAYLGVRAMDAIHFLTRSNPQLGLRYVGGDFSIDNGYNDKESDDLLRIWPGHLVMVKPENVVFPPQSLRDPMILRGSDTGSSLVRFSNDHWQMRMNGKPFLIKGLRYQPEAGAWTDSNLNGKADVWEAWMDGNRNEKRDKGEPVLGDFALMAMMGANTVLIEPPLANPTVLQEAYAKHGLYFILGSAALPENARAWPPSDKSAAYSDSKKRSKMMAEIESLVRMHKDRAYVAAWYIGDGLEPEYISKNPAAYYEFLEDAASRIHQLDPARPVIVINHDLSYADILAERVPSADIIGVNAYRGFEGFGKSFWRNWRETVRKPILITGYGSPAFGQEVDLKTSELLQSYYHENAWNDITFNAAGAPGQGSSLGGVVFEWLDHWKRAPVMPGFPEGQQRVPDAPGPFIDGGHYSEWYGLMSQGSGSEAPWIRQPRKAYWQYLKLWKRREK